MSETRFRRNALIAATTATVGALIINNWPESGPTTCYEATLGEYSDSYTTTQAITTTLDNEADTTTDYDGSTIHQAAGEAAAELRDKHVKYQDVMPGDSFDFCVQGDSVSYLVGSAEPSDV
jgi:hypothetical protein